MTDPDFDSGWAKVAREEAAAISEHRNTMLLAFKRMPGFYEKRVEERRMDPATARISPAEALSTYGGVAA